MISHKYKCIFIHIQRTAGTSIEKWLCGYDWFVIDKKTKHLLSSQAKEIYGDYWDEYFKFSFVRNPWDRMVSCLKFNKHFGLNINNGIIDVGGYMEMYGYPKILEYDQRFYNRKDVEHDRHKNKSVYGNILDEDIDFIGRYEFLYDDIKKIQKKLNVVKDFDIFAQKSNRKSYKKYYDERSKNLVNDIFLNDINYWNFNF
jgi:hypothetical protein